VVVVAVIIKVHIPNGKTSGSVIFAQLMAQCCWARWRHVTNTIELVLPSAHQCPQRKWQIDRFSHFCMDHSRVSLYFTVDHPFPVKITLSHEGSGPSSNAWFRFSCFCTDDCRI